MSTVQPKREKGGSKRAPSGNRTINHETKKDNVRRAIGVLDDLLGVDEPKDRHRFGHISLYFKEKGGGRNQFLDEIGEPHHRKNRDNISSKTSKGEAGYISASVLESGKRSQWED